MAYSSYLQIQGARQGKLKGSANKSQSIQIQSFHFSIVSPRDPASGQASGKRIHKPITIVKNIDPSSSSLFQAAATNESLSTVIVQIMQTSANGTEHLHDSVIFSNGVIRKGASGARLGPNQEIWILEFEDSDSNSAAHQKLKIAASRMFVAP